MAGARTPLFSVVLPTYDRPALLAEAVASVLVQTVDDVECIVVDDASPTPVALPAHPAVVVVRHEANRGLAAARNTGIARARGQYLTFLDDDDLFTPNRLALGLEGLERAPLALCWMQYLDPSPGVTPWNRVLDGNISDVLLEDVAPNVGQAVVERSQALAFDESFLGAEEIDWWLRMSQRMSVATVQEVGYLYRHHNAPRNSNSFATRVRDRTRILDAHADYFAGHQKALAFQWKRIGLLALRAGDRPFARRAFLRSFRVRPEPRTAWHALRSYRTRSR